MATLHRGMEEAEGGERVGRKRGREGEEKDRVRGTCVWIEGIKRGGEGAIDAAYCWKYKFS